MEHSLREAKRHLAVSCSLFAPSISLALALFAVPDLVMIRDVVDDSLHDVGVDVIQRNFAGITIAFERRATQLRLHQRTTCHG